MHSSAPALSRLRPFGNATQAEQVASCQSAPAVWPCGMLV
ncbi:hypothetical protein APY04_3251 [Hyphomicrobium sulfonivorans]|uniref:Uncharacterized protein n=1 Tax=Hyphomicrobium sulfonivorans TaxID=121290 RepID=A0A109B9C7_HYPSL|nr:hypothetical protein APY04_3251 [Hyphomicrobium sulfonivorans]